MLLSVACPHWIVYIADVMQMHFENFQRMVATIKLQIGMFFPFSPLRKFYLEFWENRQKIFTES